MGDLPPADSIVVTFCSLRNTLQACCRNYPSSVRTRWYRAPQEWAHLRSVLCPVLWPLGQSRPAPYRSPVHYRRVLARSWKRGYIPRLPSRRVWRSFLCHPPFRLHQQFRSCCLTSCFRSTARERPFRQLVRLLQFSALPVSPSWTSRVPLTSALLDRSAPVLDSASAVPSSRRQRQSRCQRGNYSSASTFLLYSRCRACARSDRARGKTNASLFKVRCPPTACSPPALTRGFRQVPLQGRLRKI